MTGLSQPLPALGVFLSKQFVDWLYGKNAFIILMSDLGAMMTRNHTYARRLTMPFTLPFLETGVLLLLAAASGLG